MVLSVGAFVEGELYLSWMQVFSKPFFCLLFFSLFTFLFFYSFIQGLIGGHCLGVVTRADSVTSYRTVCSLGQRLKD
jgi:hypothetical protein